jgi:hypothetical protein
MHQPGAEKQSATTEGDFKATTKIQTRHLQEWSNPDGATVTEISPLDERARGEYDAPNRESGAYRHHHR